MLAKLLPERHNLYGNSLDFKLNICKKKIKKMFGFHSAKNYVNENEVKYDIVQAQVYIPVLLSDASQDALKLVPDSPN